MMLFRKYLRSRDFFKFQAIALAGILQQLVATGFEPLYADVDYR